MHIIIYHPNSFGGTYDYSILIFEAFQKHPRIEKCTLLLPENAAYTGANVEKILMKDVVTGHKLYKKLHFLSRSFLNPLLLWWYVRGKKANIIFDEFEQITSFFWSPLFRWTKPKGHLYGVILHDPDRDAYPPNQTIAELSMRWIMDSMDVAIYHELLPKKKYYPQDRGIHYVSSHLGIYREFTPSEKLFQELVAQKTAEQKIAVMIGNIRQEKNYHLAIESLVAFPQLKLLIAGRAANSGVDTGLYKKQAETLGVADRIIWIERFLSDEDLAAVVAASDIVLLNYSATFKSQSAALCMVAPYKKLLLASAGESALAAAVKRYEIGVLATPDDLEAMKKGLEELLNNSDATKVSQHWDKFLASNTWETNVDIAVKAFEMVQARKQK